MYLKILFIALFILTSVYAKTNDYTMGEREIKSNSLDKGTIFVSVKGVQEKCTRNIPCSIRTGFKKARAGDILFLRGGIYKLDRTLILSSSGEKNRPIIIESYPGEVAILDGGKINPEDVALNWNDKISGVTLGNTINYVHIRKVEVRHMDGLGITVRGSHNVVEGCNIHHNFFAGIGVSGGDWHKDQPYKRGYNIIRDNSVHNNSDVGLHGSSGDGGNADGIWIGAGKYNQVVHNRVYANSDDGIDTWRSNDTYVAYNISYDNGRSEGDGNGFKLGGHWDKVNDKPKVNTKIGLRAVAEHNIAYNNKASGFDFNLGMDVVMRDNTAYNNGRYGYVGCKLARTVVSHNIASNNHMGAVHSRSDWGVFESIDNSWDKGKMVIFISTDPELKDFLRPQKGLGFDDMGAYHGLVTVPPNIIDSTHTSSNGNSLKLRMAGTFKKKSHFSFFLDTDNNPDTGYNGSNKEIQGADYLVQEMEHKNDAEEAIWYKYPEGAHGWKWEEVTRDPGFVSNCTEATALIPLFLFSSVSQPKSGHARFIAQVSTTDWSQHTYSQWQNYDLSFDDVNKIKSIELANDNEYLEITLKGNFLSNSNFDLFINSDHNEATGYSKGGKIKGVEYLVENQTLFAYAGDGSDWKWTKLAQIESHSSTTSWNAKVRLSSLDLSGGGSLGYIAQVMTQDWGKGIYGKGGTFNIQVEEKEHLFVLTQSGDFTQYSHFTFFIDADKNPNTGYTRGKIKGADFFVDKDGWLYKYPKDATGWKWDKVQGGIVFTHTDTMMQMDISSLLLDNTKSITYYAMASTADWNRNDVFDAQSLTANQSESLKKVTFTESTEALKNPLKGFMLWEMDTVSPHKYVSMFKAIIPWNKLENSINDTTEKIKSYSNKNIFDNRWYNNKKYSVQDRNIKANPLVLLKKRKEDDFSPSDMDISEHNNQTDEFIKRINNLVPKLAQAWDNDPRIGFVNMGILGTWGEQSSIMMRPAVAKALGDSFTKYFKHKKVLVRIPNYFDKTYLKLHNGSFWGVEYSSLYRFGMYWDAFGNEQEDKEDGYDTSNLINNAKLWVDQPILGEVAFNIGYQNIYDYNDYPADMKDWPDKSKNAIHDTLTHGHSLDYMKDYIRSVHCTGLSWISGYNEKNEDEAKAAQELQKIMGYRFVLKQASYTNAIVNGGKLKVSFSVQNSGSAPFYYHWPVEVSLLDINSKKVVWHNQFKNVDIRNWLPGSEWDFNSNRYKKSAKMHTIEESFTLPNNLQSGEYILALSINDPAGNHPSVQFAVTNHYKDGRTPLGIVGVSVEPSEILPEFDSFDEAKLHYDKTSNGSQGNNSKAKIFIIGDSTVHNEDYPDYNGGYFERGWGDVISQYMKNPNNVFNEARSGASSSSYKIEKVNRHDWVETKNIMKNVDISNGAYLLIQFGHNDAAIGKSWYTKPGVGNQFYNELKVYIDEARELGVTPVLITPVERPIKNRHAHISYANTIRELAKNENVLLLELTEKSFNEFNRYGSTEEIHEKFSYRANDHTHFNPIGARIVAGWVKELACNSKDKNLCNQFK